MSKVEQAWREASYAFIIFVMTVLLSAFLLLGCKSAYPGCDAKSAEQFRCNGSVVEFCDGESWSPRWDCAEIYGPDGGVSQMSCEIGEVEGDYCHGAE